MEKRYNSVIRADCAAAAYLEYDEESPGIAGQDA